MAFIWPSKMAERVGASAAGSARPLWRSSLRLTWCLQGQLIHYRITARVQTRSRFLILLLVNELVAKLLLGFFCIFKCYVDV